MLVLLSQIWLLTPSPVSREQCLAIFLVRLTLFASKKSSTAEVTSYSRSGASWMEVGLVNFQMLQQRAKELYVT